MQSFDERTSRSGNADRRPSDADRIEPCTGGDDASLFGAFRRSRRNLPLVLDWYVPPRYHLAHWLHHSGKRRTQNILLLRRAREFGVFDPRMDRTTDPPFDGYWRCLFCLAGIAQPGHLPCGTPSHWIHVVICKCATSSDHAAFTRNCFRKLVFFISNSGRGLRHSDRNSSCVLFPQDTLWIASLGATTQTHKEARSAFGFFAQIKTRSSSCGLTPRTEQEVCRKH